jgi:HEAT repeat protein
LPPGTLVLTAPRTEALASDQAAALAEFARACKGAARTVSLYPRTHPSIGTSLERLTVAAARLITGAGLVILVHPDTLVIDGRSPSRPESAVGELAILLHERLVSELTIERDANADDWHALLLLLAISPEDLAAKGGFSTAFAATNRQHFSIREIDYAEVLRERGGRRKADWDHLIECCLKGRAPAFDDRAVRALLDAIEDSGLFAELLDHLQAAGPDGLTMNARAAALLHMLRGAMDALAARGDDPLQVLDAAAAALPRLTPDMVLALVKSRHQPEHGTVAGEVLTRVTDDSVAEFVATSVTAEKGATDRLAQAFEALVPDGDKRADLLHLAQEVARRAAPDQDAAFESLWHGAKDMLLSYSDNTFVSTEYARELSAARQQAVEVERVSDDPPERIAQWIASVSDESIRMLDLALLCDLLRLETDPAKWAGVVSVVGPEVERHTLLGDFGGARQLAGLVAAELSNGGRWDFSIEAGKAMDRLAGGPLVRHVIAHLRKVDDVEVTQLAGLCHVIGPALVRPLAEALAVEENTRCIRRLRELLLGFGAAGRPSVEQLKSSSNPAVRRAAIDLLRVFGGSEALPELASMLGDSDPQVQRESIRAIVQIATPDAYAVLQKAILGSSASRETMLRELIDLRDDRTIPLFCHALRHTQPRGKLAQLHADIVEALGGLSAHEESARTLRHVLYAGDWWAPLRTAAMRKAAATALRRIGSDEAMAVLQEAFEKGSRSVRAAARVEMAVAARRDRERA